MILMCIRKFDFFFKHVPCDNYKNHFVLLEDRALFMKWKEFFFSSLILFVIYSFKRDYWDEKYAGFA